MSFLCLRKPVRTVVRTLGITMSWDVGLVVTCGKEEMVE